MSRMTAARLEHLEQIAKGESPMLMVSLDSLANEDSIRTQLQTEFAKSLRAKEGFSGLIGRLQKVTAMSASRTAKVARTEKTRAVNGGRYSEIIREYLDKYNTAKRYHEKRPEKPKVQWIHTGAAVEPRSSHIALSGQVREIGDEFLPGLHYPGDPEASPRETINCHCYIRRVRSDE